MNLPLTDQIRDYFDAVDREQGAVDLAAVLRGVERGEVIMVDVSQVDSPPARQRRWWVGGLAAAAAVAVVVAGLVVTRSGDDDLDAVDTTPTSDEASFASADALSVADDALDGYNAGDVAGVLALFAPDATTSYRWCCGSDIQTRRQFERYLVWNAAQRSELIDRSCSVADQPATPAATSGPPTDAVIVVCTFGDQDAVTRGGALDPIPITLTLVIAADGIHDWNREIGSPDYGTCCADFHRWVAANHPDDVDTVSGPPGGAATIESARADGELLARLADEWAATLTADDANASDGSVASDVIAIAAAMYQNGRPSIVEAGGAIWLRNADPGGNFSVVRVDTTTGDAVQVPMNAMVYSLVASDDAVWASIGGTGDVVRIDLASAAVSETFEFGSSTERFSDLFIAGGGLWVTGGLLSAPSIGNCCPDVDFARIDLTTRAVTSYSSSFYLGDWIGEIDGGLWAYIAATTIPPIGKFLTRVDVDSGEGVQQYELGHPEGGPPLPGYDFGVVDIYRAVARFDVESGLLTDRLALGAGPGGGVWGGVYVDGGVWITRSLEGEVVRIDAATAEVTDTVTLEPLLGESLLVGDSLWVTKTRAVEGDLGLVHSDGVVYRIDLVKRSLAETIEIGLDGQLVPFLKDGEVWVAASDGQTVQLKAIG